MLGCKSPAYTLYATPDAGLYSPIYMSMRDDAGSVDCITWVSANYILFALTGYYFT